MKYLSLCGMVYTMIMDSPVEDINYLTVDDIKKKEIEYYMMFTLIFLFLYSLPKNVLIEFYEQVYTQDIGKLIDYTIEINKINDNIYEIMLDIDEYQTKYTFNRNNEIIDFFFLKNTDILKIIKSKGGAHPVFSDLEDSIIRISNRYLDTVVPSLNLQDSFFQIEKKKQFNTRFYATHFTIKDMRKIEIAKYNLGVVDVPVSKEYKTLNKSRQNDVLEFPKFLIFKIQISKKTRLLQIYLNRNKKECSIRYDDSSTYSGTYTTLGEGDRLVFEKSKGEYTFSEQDVRKILNGTWTIEYIKTRNIPNFNEMTQKFKHENNNGQIQSTLIRNAEGILVQHVEGILEMKDNTTIDGNFFNYFLINNFVPSNDYFPYNNSMYTMIKNKNTDEEDTFYGKIKKVYDNYFKYKGEYTFPKNNLRNYDKYESKNGYWIDDDNVTGEGKLTFYNKVSIEGNFKNEYNLITDLDFIIGKEGLKIKFEFEKNTPKIKIISNIYTIIDIEEKKVIQANTNDINIITDIIKESNDLIYKIFNEEYYNIRFNDPEYRISFEEYANKITIQLQIQKTKKQQQQKNKKKIEIENLKSTIFSEMLFSNRYRNGINQQDWNNTDNIFKYDSSLSTDIKELKKLGYKYDDFKENYEYFLIAKNKSNIPDLDKFNTLLNKYKEFSNQFIVSTIEKETVELINDLINKNKVDKTNADKYKTLRTNRLDFLKRNIEDVIESNRREITYDGRFKSNLDIYPYFYDFIEKIYDYKEITQNQQKITPKQKEIIKGNFSSTSAEIEKYIKKLKKIRRDNLVKNYQNFNDQDIQSIQTIYPKVAEKLNLIKEYKSYSDNISLSSEQYDKLMALQTIKNESNEFTNIINKLIKNRKNFVQKSIKNNSMTTPSHNKGKLLFKEYAIKTIQKDNIGSSKQSSSSSRNKNNTGTSYKDYIDYTDHNIQFIITNGIYPKNNSLNLIKVLLLIKYNNLEHIWNLIKGKILEKTRYGQVDIYIYDNRNLGEGKKYENNNRYRTIDGNILHLDVKSGRGDFVFTSQQKTPLSGFDISKPDFMDIHVPRYEVESSAYQEYNEMIQEFEKKLLKVGVIKEYTRLEKNFMDTNKNPLDDFMCLFLYFKCRLLKETLSSKVQEHPTMSSATMSSATQNLINQIYILSNDKYKDWEGGSGVFIIT